MVSGKMNPEPKRFVLEALRSREFRQIRHAMHVEGRGYCFEGVVCEVFRRVTGRGEWYPTVKGRFRFRVDTPTTLDEAPPEVQEWLWKKGERIRFLGNNVYPIDLNDAQELSFLMLASVIESKC